MILVDTNVFIYANGKEHPNKARAVAFLKRVVQGEIDATMDAEVLQEIIHRYRSIDRWADGLEVYAMSRDLFPEVLAITGTVMR